MADYREPITLKNVQEVSTGFSFSPKENEIHAEIDISTEEGKRAMHMLKNGLACNFCYTTFPARPGPDTIKEFEPTFHLFPINPDVQRDRIKDGACNLCGFKATNENAEKMIRDEALAMARRMFEGLQDS